MDNHRTEHDKELADLRRELAAEMAYWDEAPARFFQAWKKAAALGGAYYFGDGTEGNFGRASSKDDLAPDFQKIKKALGVLSSGEGAFLAVLYSFYNDRDGQELMTLAGIGGMADIAATLDLKRRRLIADLLLTYNGW